MSAIDVYITQDAPDHALIRGGTDAGKRYVGSIFVRGMEILDAETGLIRVPYRIVSNIAAECRSYDLSYALQ